MSDSDSDSDIFIDSSDEEPIEEHEEAINISQEMMIECIVCRELLSHTDEFILFEDGRVYCMECSEQLEHTIEIMTDDED